jgi:hypothetical protein
MTKSIMTGARKTRLYRVFLLSPAHAGGERARMLLREGSQSEVAIRLRRGAATLGEAFTFISGLYFRGKLAYAEAYAAPPPGVPGALVITGGQGLLPPETPVTLEQLLEIAAVPIDLANPGYRLPLERDCRLLEEASGSQCDIVLLGSLATPKYLEPVMKIFGNRLLVPQEFIGRGDLSRGGLMLRCVREGSQLTYMPAETFMAPRAIKTGIPPP